MILVNMSVKLTGVVLRAGTLEANCLLGLKSWLHQYNLSIILCLSFHVCKQSSTVVFTAVCKVEHHCCVRCCAESMTACELSACSVDQNAAALKATASQPSHTGLFCCRHDVSTWREHSSLCCAVQPSWLSVSHLLVCVCVCPKLSIYPSPAMFPFW